MTKVRCCWMLALLLAPAAHAQLVGTAFTYQGALSVNNQLANGTYDLRFDAYPALASGPALNPIPVIVDNVVIANGVFTADVDFGAAVFLGAPVFLEIGVREGAAGGPGDTTGFQGLTPRQRVRPAPYALHAEGVALDSIGSAQIANASVGSADIDTAQVQRRIASGCAVNQSIRSVAADGSVTCDADNDSGGTITAVTAGTGLSGGGTSGGVTIDINGLVVPRKDAAGGNQAFDTDLLFLDYPNNRIGIGNVAPAFPFALDVTGAVRASADVTASAFKLPVNLTGYYSIAASDFVQSGAGLDDDAYQFPTTSFGAITAGTGVFDVRLSAPVQLPHGADPATITCEFFDADAVQNLSISVTLFKKLPGAISIANHGSASLTTSGASANIQSTSTSVSPGPFDGQSNYSLLVNYSNTGLSPDLRFYGCQISYTYSQMGP